MKKESLEIVKTREMPNNIEAEQAILGAFLNNNEHIEKVIDFLKPESFFSPIHQKIFKLITKFTEKNSIANPITLKSYFKDEELMDQGMNMMENSMNSMSDQINNSIEGNGAHSY